MKYIKRQTPSYNLHLIKTDKFKTINIEIIFNRILKKEEITIINFLASILTYTTKKYNTKIKFSQEMENLYACKVFSNNYRLGKNFNIDINMEVLNEKYAEKNLLRKALEFLKEIIFNPNVENDMFDKKSFDVIKNDEISQIERFRENTRRYAALRLMELTDNTMPFSYNLKGYLEDLEKITRNNLYDFYKEFINTSNIDIFIVGDIDFSSTEKIIKEIFSFNKEKTIEISPLIEWGSHRKKIQEVIEKDNTNQAKLSISCKIENITKFERNYVLNLYNLILGGTADSKFFKNIREKYSLCYYVTSGANKLDNMILVSSGITKDNFSKIMILIKKEMDNMRKGLFEDIDMEKAKKYYLVSLEEIEDNSNQIIASYYAMDKLGIEDIETRKEKIQTVTKEDIIALANKVFIDTVYLLGGDKK